jgi:hypothetical protein
MTSATRPLDPTHTNVIEATQGPLPIRIRILLLGMKADLTGLTTPLPGPIRGR